LSTVAGQRQFTNIVAGKRVGRGPMPYSRLGPSQRLF
jgi:hypothetical protein